MLSRPNDASGMTKPMLVAVILGFAASSSPAAEPEDGFEPIFDGKTLKGWDGDPRFWRVEEGAITGQTTKENPTKGNTFIIWTGGKLGDFELKLEYRIVDGNSGIQYRSFRLDGAPDKWRIGGYQADIDSGDTFSGIIYGERARGILARRGQMVEIGPDGQKKVVEMFGDSKKIQEKIKKEDWNRYRIVARGNHLTQYINGVKTAELIDNDKKAQGRQMLEGLLALQLHAGPPMKVQFRNIRLKTLPDENAKSEDSALRIDVPDGKSVIVAGQRLNLAELASRLKQKPVPKSILIAADRQVPLAFVHQVISTAQQAGVEQFRLTVKKDQDKPQKHAPAEKPATNRKRLGIQLQRGAVDVEVPKAGVCVKVDGKRIGIDVKGLRIRIGELTQKADGDKPHRVEVSKHALKLIQLGLRGKASAVLSRAAARPDQQKKKIVFIAGRRSHGYGAHEHKAGCMLLAKALNESGLAVKAEVVTGGWPDDESVLDGAVAIVVYADGGGRHPLNAHLEKIDALMDKGVGLVCIHYAVEVPKGKPGDAFLDWTGGYFETHWSVNPHWTAEYKKLPDHPATRGVKPFTLRDEWYYHMRFRENLAGVTPILTDLPPAQTLKRPDGGHSNNPHVRKAVLQNKQPQHTAWATEREGGGRGFGITGGHFHWNWGHNQFRKLVLNAIAWAAHVHVPKNGVPSKPLTVKDLTANQDYEPPKNFNPARIQKMLDDWNRDDKDATSSAPVRHTKDSLETVKERLAAGNAVLIDVREKEEWEAGHLDDARLVPLSGLSGGEKSLRTATKALPRDKPLYLHCRSGGRVLPAAELLREAGFDARPLKAGFADLLKAGFRRGDD